MTDHLTCRVPAELRDTDGVRLDAMLDGAGAVVLRELPRVGSPAGFVDLLVEDTTAPAAVRGQIVRPLYDEIDGELSFDRWEPVATPSVHRDSAPAPSLDLHAPDLAVLSDEDLLAELVRRRDLGRPEPG